MMLYALADRGVNLEMEDCREWVRSRLQERGCKPSEFVRTAPCYDPSQANVDGRSAGMSVSHHKVYIANHKLRFVFWLSLQATCS